MTDTGAVSGYLCHKRALRFEPLRAKSSLFNAASIRTPVNVFRASGGFIIALHDNRAEWFTDLHRCSPRMDSRQLGCAGALLVV
jgi:hypothetical protein